MDEVAASREWLADSKGTPIHIGDVLRVFHFVAAQRRQRIYMYKQAVGYRTIGSDQYGYSKCIRFSHLDLGASEYVEPMNGRLLESYEVVQSIHCDHQSRPKHLPPQAAIPISKRGELR